MRLKLNFEARDYTEVVDWDLFKSTPPPRLWEVTNDLNYEYKYELKVFVANTLKPQPP